MARQRSANSDTPAFIPYANQADQSSWVEVTYSGPAGKRYVPSPTKKVRHYGYHSGGVVIMVHPDDQKHSPEMFVLTNQEPEVEEVFDFTALSGIGPSKNEALHESGYLSKDSFLSEDSETLAEILSVSVESIEEWKSAL